MICLPVLAMTAIALGQVRVPRDTLFVLTVLLTHDGGPVEAAVVRSGGTSSSSNARGRAELRLAPGEHEITVAKIGFRAESLRLVLRSDTTVSRELTALPAELSEIVVSSTRTGRRVQDEPLRVEVLSQEEVEEKLRMTPGDITMMLNETSGLRVQTTSPSLGGANVRIQGLRGRYTQILADGLPLYGGQTGGLGLLQIPPLDLGGVEVIKGISSALYGGSALGGVINLLSRRPGDRASRELLLNQTTLGGSDAVGFLTGPASRLWSYTVLAGVHRQPRRDRDGDSWTDVPGYLRGVLRPRAFWSHPRGHWLMLTAGTTLERREGGTLTDSVAPDGFPYPERLRTTRFDAGAVGEFRLSTPATLSVRGSAAWQRHRHTFGEVVERDRHLTWFGEAALAIAGAGGRSHLVAGLAMQEESYRASDVAGFDFTFTSPGLFAQHTVDLDENFALTTSARVDRHSKYGTKWSPRVSALIRLGPGWSLRGSAGRGHFAPTPFTEETEVTGLTPLVPLTGIVAERAWGGSVDLAGTVATSPGGEGGEPVEVVLTLFGSVVEDPVALRRVGEAEGQVELTNSAGPTRTGGGEVLVRWHPHPFYAMASYTLVRSREQDPETGERRDAPLAPRQQAGLLVGWEAEGESRIGVEVYYTGRQALSENPYRTESRPYVHIGVLAEQRFGPARIYVNVENALGYRQTRYDPLVLPDRGLGGRWTTDVWAPLDGRVANIGIRLGGS